MKATAVMVNKKGAGTNKSKKFFSLLFMYIIIICLSYIIIYPFLIKLLVSVKSVPDLSDPTVNLIPKHLSLEIVKKAMELMQFKPAIINSLILSLFVGVLQIASSAMIGYGISRFKFWGRGFLYAIVVISLLIPAQTTMTAMFLQFRYFDVFGLFQLILGKPINLIDTVMPFGILSATGFGLKNGLYIYLAIQFFKGMPKELEEAAYVDGAGDFKIFLKVMLPNAIPILITIFLFSFCWQWTDTYYSGLFLSNWAVLPRTVNYILSFGDGNVDPVYVSAMANAGVLLVLVPLVILYVICQKFFIQGIERSGMTG